MFEKGTRNRNLIRTIFLNSSIALPICISMFSLSLSLSLSLCLSLSLSLSLSVSLSLCLSLSLSIYLSIYLSRALALITFSVVNINYCNYSYYSNYCNHVFIIKGHMKKALRLVYNRCKTNDKLRFNFLYLSIYLSIYI